LPLNIKKKAQDLSQRRNKKLLAKLQTIEKLPCRKSFRKSLKYTNLKALKSPF
jgi:hypothetical protein